jgi:general secretion pathway protein H
MIKTKGCPGFTLMELMVVLVIVALTAAFVVPRLGSLLSRLGSLSAAKKTCACLRYARSIAASGKKAYKVVFDIDKNTLTVSPFYEDSCPEKPGDGGKPFNKSYQLPGGVFFEELVDSHERYADSGKFTMVFFPNGGSSGGKIILKDEKHRKFTIDVDPISGAVRVVEP